MSYRRRERTKTKRTVVEIIAETRDEIQKARIDMLRILMQSVGRLEPRRKI